MKNKKLALGLMAAGVATVGLSGWTYWTGTPSYALQEVASAVKGRDLAAFEERVDVDRVAEGAVDELWEGMRKEAMAQVMGDDEPLAAVGMGAALQLMAAMKDPAVELLSTRIRSGISGSSTPAAVDEYATSGPLPEMATWVEQTAAHARVEGLLGIDRNGNRATAQVRIRHSDLDTTFTMDVAMEKGEGWQVVRLEDPVGYIERLEETQTIRLKERNAALARHMASLAPVGELSSEVRSRSAGWGFGYERTLHATIPITNAGDAPLNAVEVAVEDGESGRSLTFEFDVRIGPGATAELQGTADYSSRNALHRALRDGEYENVVVKVRQLVQRRPEGSDTLALYPTWQDYLARSGGR